MHKPIENRGTPVHLIIDFDVFKDYKKKLLNNILKQMSSLIKMKIKFNDNRNKRNRIILDFLRLFIDENISINISYNSLHKNIHFFQGKIFNLLVDFYTVE